MNSKIFRKSLLTLFDLLSSYLVICAALVSPTLEYGPSYHFRESPAWDFGQLVSFYITTPAEKLCFEKYHDHVIA